MATNFRINHQIRSQELRLIAPDGENLGVFSLSDALSKAHELDLDLIEISPTAKPPIAKIAEYGKFLYEEKKKQKVAKTRTHRVEIKTIQVKVGTGEHDLGLKAKKISEWLKEGHRVKVDLFLPGRTKYLEFNFLKERMERVLKLITEEYRVAEASKKSPKGLSVLIEKGK